MSILGRLNKIAHGLGHSATDYADFVMDNVKDMWGESDDAGFAAVWDHLGNVLGSAYANDPVVGKSAQGKAANRRLQLAGAKRRDYDFTDGFADIADAIPESARSAIKTLTGQAVRPVGAAMAGANRAYEDVVDRPLSFLMTVGSLYDSPEFMESLSGMSIGDRAKKVAAAAWGMSEDRSFGDALAYAGGTRDILSEDQMSAAENGDWFHTISFAGNLLPAVVADPTGLALQSFKEIRAGQALAEANNFRRGYDVAEADRAYAAVSKAKTVAEVRNKMFPSRNALEGPAWAAALFDAKQQGREAFDLTLRGLLGQSDAIDTLAANHKQLAYQLGKLTENRNALLVKWNGALVAPERDRAAFDLLDNAVAETNSQAARLERTLAVTGSLDTIPKVSRASEARAAMTRTDFYRKSWLAAPLRTVFGMNPQRVLSVHADDFDVQLDRFMRKAGVDPEMRDLVRSQAIDANRMGPKAIRDAKDAAEAAAVEAIAARHNVPPEFIMGARSRGVKETDDLINHARFDANSGNTIVKFADDEGNLVERHIPLSPEQLRNYVFLPDAKAIEREAKSLSGTLEANKFFTHWLAGSTGTAEVTASEAADWALGKFNRVWKPAVLLSVRWPMRVVGEEQVRALSKIGALDLARAHKETVTGFIGDKLGRTADELVDVPYVARRPVVVNGDTFAPSLMERNGPAVEARLLEETASYNRMYGQHEVGLRSNLYAQTQDWVELQPGDNRYMEAWSHAANNQLGRSRLARRLMENGMDTEDAVRWLKTDPEGVRFAQTLPIRSRDPEGWVAAVEDQILRYLPDEELRQAALNHAFTPELAERVLPNAASQPIVHGQNLTELLGHERSFAETVGKHIDGAMQHLMQTPTVRLSRQPVFDALYRKRIADLVERAADEGLEMTDARRALIERSARRHALGESRELLYDMAEHSQLGEALRFIAPFVDASREVITRWAGITVDNPLFVRRLQVLWQQPEKAGFVYDGMGRQVQPDGKVIDVNGRRVNPEGGKYVRFVAPEWAKDIPVIGEVLRGGVQFNKESVNTIIANPFGAGPLVQVAMAKLYNPTPEQQEQWKWLFPYGMSDDVKTLLPTTVREAVKGEDERSRAALTMHIWNDLATTWELNGRSGHKPTIEEAKHIEGRIHQLMIAPSKFLSPVGLQSLSPYQPYIDYLHQLQNADPSTAGQEFYDKFGVEFAALANSVSRSNDNVPPTVAAYRQREKYAALIERFPELGGIIVDDVDGKFSNAVYQEQLTRALGPNTDKKQRELVPKDEFVKRPYISAGWSEFSKAMDAIDAIRVQRALPNLKVKAARDLYEAKQEIVAHIASKYPDWWDEYRVVDPAKAEKKVDGLRAIANDPMLGERDDIRLLHTWIVARDVMAAELRRRNRAGDSGDLNATSNIDLANQWGSITSALVERNLMFSKLYYRYLDNLDPSGLKGAA